MSEIKTVTKEKIDAKIFNVTYLQPHGTTLTVCLLVLQNATIIVGESACVDPAKFNADFGKQLAYANAYEKIWALEGYLLKEEMYVHSLK